MDLTKRVPRSPYAKLGDYRWLARITDKARAHAAGTAGEYHYNCPMDASFLEFWGLSGDAFLQQAASGLSDEEISAWVRANAKSHSAEQIREFEIALLDTPPSDPGKLDYLKTYQESVAPGRTDLNTFAKVIATEETHPSPALV
jgi:hypothetical protein